MISCVKLKQNTFDRFQGDQYQSADIAHQVIVDDKSLLSYLPTFSVNSEEKPKIATKDAINGRQMYKYITFKTVKMLKMFKMQSFALISRMNDAKW